MIEGVATDVDGRYSPGCDIGGNRAVDLADLSALLSQFGSPGPGLTADLDEDGDVDLADLAMLLSRFGQLCP